MEEQAQTIRMPGVPWPTHVRHSGSRTMHYNNALPDKLIDALWERPEEVIAGGRVMRQTPWRSAVLVESGSQAFVMKQYFSRSLRFCVKQTILGSQALRSYKVGCALADAGVRTPRPVACIDNRWRGLQRDCFLLYPHVEGACLRSSISFGQLNDTDIAKAWNQLQTLWEQLTALRVGLKDANTGNFIITAEGTLWLIDLDDSCIHRSAILARARLQNRWFQVYRSVRRATRRRDQILKPAWRAAA
jgi:hypothetical protein